MRLSIRIMQPISKCLAPIVITCFMMYSSFSIMIRPLSLSYSSQISQPQLLQCNQCVFTLTVGFSLVELRFVCPIQTRNYAFEYHSVSGLEALAFGLNELTFFISISLNFISSTRVLSGLAPQAAPLKKSRIYHYELTSLDLPLRQ